MRDGSRQPRCYIEANIFIIAFEGQPENADPLKKLFDLAFPHKLADAIPVSKAVGSGCSFLMSSDKGVCRLPPSLTRLEPDAAGIATVLDALRA